MARVALRPGQQGAVSASKYGKQWRARTRIGARSGSAPIQLTALGPTRSAAINRVQARAEETLATMDALEPAAATSVFIATDSTVHDLAEEWWRRYQKRDVAPGTLRAYSTALHKHLLGRFGDLTVKSSTVGELDRRMRAFEEETGLGSKTLRVVLGHVFDLAVRNDLLTTNPVRSIEPAPRGQKASPRALTGDEWTQAKGIIVQWGEGTTTTPRDSQTLLDVLMALAATGNRVNETLALRPCDLNLDGEVPTATIAGGLVYEKGRGLRHDRPKTKSSVRTVVLPAFVIGMLRDRVALAPTATSPIFPSGRGTWLWANNLRRQWRDARKGTDLEWMSFHHLRKTVLTLVADSLTIDAAAAQAGHRSTRTTVESYVAKPPLARDAQAIAALLNEALGDN